MEIIYRIDADVNLQILHVYEHLVIDRIRQRQADSLYSDAALYATIDGQTYNKMSLISVTPTSLPVLGLDKFMNFIDQAITDRTRFTDREIAQAVKIVETERAIKFTDDAIQKLPSIVKKLIDQGGFQKMDDHEVVVYRTRRKITDHDHQNKFHKLDKIDNYIVVGTYLSITNATPTDRLNLWLMTNNIGALINDASTQLGGYMHKVAGSLATNASDRDIACICETKFRKSEFDDKRLQDFIEDGLDKFIRQIDDRYLALADYLAYPRARLDLYHETGIIGGLSELQKMVSPESLIKTLRKLEIYDIEPRAAENKDFWRCDPNVTHQR